MNKLELHKDLEPFRSTFEKTIKPYNEININVEKEIPIWRSKFGGIPYLPKGVEHPRNKAGKPLYLLAQINFEEFPNLEMFPEKGILQFYISNNIKKSYGIGNATYTLKQDNYRVLYFDDIDKNIKIETNFVDPFIKGGHFPLEFYAPWNKNENPMDTMAISFKQKFEPLPFWDDFYWNVFFPEFNSHYMEYMKAVGTEDEEYFYKEFWTWGYLGTNYDFFKKLTSNENIHEEDVYKWYSQFYNSRANKIGGYSFFAQDDIRNLSLKDYDILLLQIVSGDFDISWGDCGVAHFFIKKEDLVKKDFSKVCYHWDGY